jgi:glycosyltransferase involved in cell wall biosynthesis
MSQLMVSICCAAYNHEEYIAAALDGFLMQKADFSYEILVHDDASTDNTAKIIKEYEQNYPDIIKPIYQTENQYSKKVKISSAYNFPRAKGKYIAWCEGDDYWTDPLKLQTQVDYMEAHPECSLCAHAAEQRTADGKLLQYIRPSMHDKSFSVAEIIEGGGGLFATNSLMFPAALVQEVPDFYIDAPVGDAPLMIYLALQGDVYYIDRCMSAYRFMAEGSWSKKTYNNDAKHMEHAARMIAMYQEIDEYTEHRYAAAIHEIALFYEFMIWRLKMDLKQIRSDKYRRFYNELTGKEKAGIFIKAYFPFLLKLWRKIKGK